MNITQQQQIAIDEISRFRTDGGLGVGFDGENYYCQDVRDNPVFSEYWPILNGYQIDGNWYPLVTDEEDAPFGYSAPVLEDRNGQAVAARYAIGTFEERAAETKRLLRASVAVDSWQGRYILAGMEPVSAGPLSSYPGSNVLEQVNAFVAANLTAPEQERYKGAMTWRRDDPMIASIGAMLGLDDSMIDAWFDAAGAIQ